MSRVFIFNFHRVSDEHSPAFPPIPQKTFERILRFLNRRFIIIPQEELLTKLQTSTHKDFCVLTFDDGYADFVNCALPLLEKYKLPSTLHVVTEVASTGKMFWTQRLNKIVESYSQIHLPIEHSAFNKIYTMKNDKEVEMTALEIYLQLLGNPEREFIINDLSKAIHDSIQETKMLLWKDIVNLPRDFVSIGSHTHTHNNLMNLSINEIKVELTKSYNMIKENVGIAPLSIAYPNGQYNDSINELAKEVGYKIYYTCNGCKNTLEQKDLFHRANLYNRQYWKNYLKIKMWEYR